MFRDRLTRLVLAAGLAALVSAWPAARPAGAGGSTAQFPRFLEGTLFTDLADGDFTAALLGKKLSYLANVDGGPAATSAKGSASVKNGVFKGNLAAVKGQPKITGKITGEFTEDPDTGQLLLFGNLNLGRSYGIGEYEAFERQPDQVANTKLAGRWVAPVGDPNTIVANLDARKGKITISGSADGYGRVTFQGSYSYLVAEDAKGLGVKRRRKALGALGGPLSVDLAILPTQVKLPSSMQPLDGSGIPDTLFGFIDGDGNLELFLGFDPNIDDFVLVVLEQSL